MQKLSLALATVLALTGAANAATLNEKNMPLDVRQVQRLGRRG